MANPEMKSSNLEGLGNEIEETERETSKNLSKLRANVE
jgi:hypothetical protein